MMLKPLATDDRIFCKLSFFPESSFNSILTLSLLFGCYFSTTSCCFVFYEINNAYHFKKKSELFSLKNCCIQTYDFDKFDKRIAHYTFSKFNSPHKYFLSTYLTEISATNEAH